MNPTEKVKALEIIGKYKIKECLPTLIANINKVAPHFDDNSGPFESMFPCVDAIIKIGEDSTPFLIQAILNEKKESRLRLMSYALMKIMTKKLALAHIENLLKSTASKDERASLVAAQNEIIKWQEVENKDHD